MKILATLAAWFAIPAIALAAVGDPLPVSLIAATPSFDSHFEQVTGSAVGKAPAGWCTHLQANWNDAIACDATTLADGTTPADRFYASNLKAATLEVELLTTPTSCPGTVAVQTYTNSVYIHATPLTAAQQASSNCGRGYGLLYSSGGITTRYLFNQSYGYVEASIKAPVGNGSWPTFFGLPATKPVTNRTPPAANDNWCELDVLEKFNDGNRNGKASQTTHLKDTTYANAVNVLSPVEDSTIYHTYGVNITSTLITFYRDRIETMETPNIGCAGPWYWIAYVAMGGTGGTPDNHTTQSMFIKYIKAWAPPSS